LEENIASHVAVTRTSGNPFKLLVINSFYAPAIGGGAEVTIQNLYQVLARRGFEIVVLATDGKARASVDYDDQIKVVRMPLFNIYWHLRRKFPPKLVRTVWHLFDIINPVMGLRALRVIKTERPDCVIFHNIAGWSIAVWLAALICKIPTICVLHDSYLICPSSLMFKHGHGCKAQCVTCSLFRFPHKIVSRRIDGVVGVSRYIVNRMLSEGLFAKATSVVINNAREIPNAVENRADRPELIFGYIGTIMPAKGVTWMIRQFAEAGIPNKLRIAGTGDPAYITELKTIALEHNLDVEFLGHVDSYEFFGSIDVSLVPSIWPDTFPGVAFEACANDVPVIASNRGGLPEIIRDGINGLVCDPENPSTLAAAVNRLRDDKELLKRLRANSRASVTPMLDPNRMADEHISFIKEVVRRRTCHS